MSIIQSPEFFINQKSIPDENSVEYDAFFAEEARKMEYGVTINGIYIHGWLYFHLNHWSINIDELDPINNTIKRKFSRPQARDNEWIIAEALQQAEREKKGLMIFGSRRLGKTEFEASYIGRSATLFKGTENVITGGNWADIDLITGKLTMGLDNLPMYFRTARISENPRKEIELGFKNKQKKKDPWSKIMMRNFDNGNNTEAVAGTTASTFVLDECGKFPFAQSFDAAKPSFTSPYGWRCCPILTGTSGDIKAASDAEKYFNNPEAFNFIMRELKEEGNKKVSVFISGFRRMEGKIKTTFGDFAKTEKGILVPKDSELNTIPFWNSDFEKAGEVIDKERADAAKSPDPTALLKATMYYPKNTKELFLSDNGNNFPIEALNQHMEYLIASPELQGQAVRLYRDVDNRVKVSFNTDKKPILDYPLKANADLSIKDAAIIIYELPDEHCPAYRYVAAADPYNSAQTVNSESLGSFYIYKRMYDPINGTYQDRIVASYCARTPEIKQFYGNIEMLLELYNAIVLPENAPGNTFIQYFDLKNKGYMIADTFNLLKEISPNTSIKGSPKGLPPTTTVQKHYKELIYNYLTELIDFGINNNNGERIMKMGLCRINDIALIKELIAFTDKGNFDRYVAFGHLLEHSAWADKVYPYIVPKVFTKEQNERIEEQKKLPTVRNPFGMVRTGPLSGRSNPFGV